MIAVLADDLSGAAELAALARQLGLTAEILRDSSLLPPPLSSAIDVLVLDTHSRSLPAAQAAARLSSIDPSLFHAPPGLLYKKIDSVLRGHVLPEIDALLAATQLPRALLLPANPGRRRIIQNGCYQVDGIPLHQTAFAHDPDFPARSSRILDLLGDSRRTDLHQPTLNDQLPARGIVIPNIATAEELAQWSARVDDQTLPVGAGEFFASLLRARGYAPSHDVLLPKTSDPWRSGPALFVCGSLHAWTTSRRAQCSVQGIPVAAMPQTLWRDPSNSRALETWSHNIRSTLDESIRGRAMAAIGVPGPASDRPPAAPSSTLVDLLARALEPVLRSRPPAHVLLEGGATAAAVLSRLGWSRLVAGPPVAPGLAPLTPRNQDRPTLWIKPGSYPWPPDFFH